MKTASRWYPYFKLIGLLAASFFVVFAMWSWGLTLLSHLDSFWKILDPNREVFLSRSQNAPPPPTLNPQPSATKEKRVTVSGYSLEGILVKLFLNDQEIDSVRTDKDGNFVFPQVELREGFNSLYAKTRSSNELESLPSKTQTISFLKKAPKLEVSEPSDRANFAQKDNNITIRGQTEANTTVTINGQKAFVDAEGKFSYLYPLSDGENRLIIESSDVAGNKTTVEKLVTFSRIF